MVCGIPYVVQRGMCNMACVVCNVGQYMVWVFAVRRVHVLRFVFFGLCVVCGVLFGVCGMWCVVWGVVQCMVCVVRYVLYVLCGMCYMVPTMCCVVCVVHEVVCGV